MKLTFLGGAGTVTGSKTLVESDGCRLLVDCGLFQGFKNLRLRNRAPLPVSPGSIDTVVLTHAHLDHSGYLPLLVKSGFMGRVVCSEATRDLCGVLLPDSGYLQEQDAAFANRHGYSKHRPAEPLYTRADAERCLERLDVVAFDREVNLGEGLKLRLRRAGHILGAAIVELGVSRDDMHQRLVFSGDLGPPDDPLMVAPAAVDAADILVVESTYGNRLHQDGDPLLALQDIIGRTAARGGTLLVPAFAIGRAQLLLYLIGQLKAAGRIPDLPVALDSPMAINATELFARHHADHRLAPAEARAACAVARYVRTAEESKALNTNGFPCIIISASGMMTGGRVLHHLKHLAPDPRNAILISGFQAGGTRGAALLAGADSLKVHGTRIPVRAEVADLSQMLSAHADARQVMDWLRGFRRPPDRTFVTHGEPAAADSLRMRIEEELGWNVTVPDYRDTFALCSN